MENKNTGHVSEEELARSVVEEDNRYVMDHIEVCAECRKARESLVHKLDLLGSTARRHTPEQVRKVVLPASEQVRKEAWPYRWQLSFGFAASLAIVLFFVWHLGGPFTGGTAMQTLDDASLMAEITALEENALPDAYNEISPEESPADLGEDTLDLLVPVDEDMSLEGGIS